MSLETKIDIIEIQLISLEARKKIANGYIMNSSMIIECELLEGQIKALKETVDILMKLKNKEKKCAF